MPYPLSPEQKCVLSSILVRLMGASVQVDTRHISGVALESLQMLPLFCLTYDSEDTASGTTEWIEETRLEGHSDWVRDVAWAPSLNVARQMIASCGQDGRVIVWVSVGLDEPGAVHMGATVDPKDYVHRPGGTSWSPVVLNTYADVVWHVSWSITGNILAVSGGDNK
ncbi:WD domain, G-beta repeat protein, partial [Opisthorchis viverrini]